jgi:hypothetical protein
MTNPNIATSHHLLKRLKEEMNFLSSLLSQANSLMSQAYTVASNLEGTWTSIKHTQENWERGIEKL